MMAEERSKRDLFNSDLGLSFSAPNVFPLGISGGVMLFSIEIKTVWSATGRPPLTPHRHFRASKRKQRAESATLSSFSRINLMIIVLASLKVANCSWVTVCRKGVRNNNIIIIASLDRITNYGQGASENSVAYLDYRCGC